MALSTIQNNSFADTAVHGRRNLLINGAMQVAQRGTSFTVTNEYGLDRWFCRENTDGALTFSQDSESPAGFSKSLKVNVDTADTSLGTSQFAYLGQRIEGYVIEPLAFGSSDAKTITLSFYVRCSITGKFGGAVTNGGNDNRSYAFTYDVNSANTWERKTITITGDTTGTWNIDNTQEMAVLWSLGAGSSLKKAEGSWDATSSVQSATEVDTELVENASATWYITGVQLELGSQATPFEHRSFGDELARCERYYEKSWNYSDVPGTLTNNGAEFHQIDDGGLQRDMTKWRTKKRAAPTVTIYNTDTGTTGEVRTNASTNFSTTVYNASEGSCFLSYTPTSGQFLKYHYEADAEL